MGSEPDLDDSDEDENENESEGDEAEPEAARKMVTFHMLATISLHTY